MEEKRKKTATKQSLTNRIKDLEAFNLELVEHLRTLEQQQFLMDVEVTALKQFAFEGRTPSHESFAKRCDIIYQHSLEKVIPSDQPVSESGSEGRESGAETMVAPTHEVST